MWLHCVQLLHLLTPLILVVGDVVGVVIGVVIGVVVGVVIGVVVIVVVGPLYVVGVV